MRLELKTASRTEATVSASCAAATERSAAVEGVGAHTVLRGSALRTKAYLLPGERAVLALIGTGTRPSRAGQGPFTGRCG